MYVGIVYRWKLGLKCSQVRQTNTAIKAIIVRYIVCLAIQTTHVCFILNQRELQWCVTNECLLFLGLLLLDYVLYAVLENKNL